MLFLCEFHAKIIHFNMSFLAKLTFLCQFVIDWCHRAPLRKKCEKLMKFGANEGLDKAPPPWSTHNSCDHQNDKDPSLHTTTSRSTSLNFSMVVVNARRSWSSKQSQLAHHGLRINVYKFYNGCGSWPTVMIRLHRQSHKQGLINSGFRRKLHIFCLIFEFLSICREQRAL